MNRLATLTLLTSLLSAGNALATEASPTTLPTSAPATTAPVTAAPAIATPAVQSKASNSPHRKPSTILPDEYMILADHSIFRRGSHTTHFAGDSAGTGSNSNSAGDAANQHTKSNSPEESLVFEGAMNVGNQIVAFVEDRAAGKVLLVQDGDTIAQGHVTSISLDSLQFAGKDGETHVGIGQTLRGKDAAPAEESGAASSNATAASPGGAPATTTDNSQVPLTPGVSPTPGATTGGSADSILERLRQRRAAERAAIEGK